MSAISIKIDMVRGMTPGLGQNCVRASAVKSGISSIRSQVDSKIQARRSIGPRLTHAYQAANQIEMSLNKLQSFINKSMNQYSAAEDYVSHLGPKYGLHVPTARDYILNLLPFAKRKMHAFWDKLKVGAGAVTANAKRTFSKIKKAFEPGGALYKPFQIGKAVLGIAVGLVTVVGSIASMVATGGLDSPLAVLGVIYGVNDIINNSYGLFQASKGHYDKMDDFNLLENTLAFAGETVGGLMGNKKAGRLIGEGAFYVGDVALIFKSLPEAGKNLMKLKQISKAGLLRDAKTIIPNTIKAVKDGAKDLSKVSSVRKLTKALNLENLKNDIKSVHKISDITKIRAVEGLKKVDYSKVLNKTINIMVTEPRRAIGIQHQNIATAWVGATGLKDIIKSPFDVIDKTKEDFNTDEKENK